MLKRIIAKNIMRISTTNGLMVYKIFNTRYFFYGKKF